MSDDGIEDRLDERRQSMRVAACQRIVNSMDVTTIQWESAGGTEVRFKWMDFLPVPRTEETGGH